MTQPDPTAAIEVFARLLCAADVHVHGDDHPTWQQLVGEPGHLIRDDYRKAAAWLLPRMTVATKPAAQSPADRAVVRARIAEAIRADLTSTAYRRDGGLLGIVPRLADAVLAVLPEPADRAADDLAAATCGAQYHGTEEVRQCIRAAQHTGEAHTDQNGFHWSDTVAVYRLADGTWRTGTDVRAELRRLAGGQAARDEARTAWTTGPVAVAQAGEAARTAAAYLATPCDTCEHTLNWHQNDVGCTVSGCVCSRFTEEPSA